MYACENWTKRKVEYQRIDAFKLWCWRKFLKIPWITRRSNQSMLKEINVNIHWKDWCWSWNSSIWLPNVNSWLTGKDSDAGKDWGQEEKGAIKDELVGCHQWLNGHELEQTPGDREGQGSLACCSPLGCKKSDKTKQQQYKSIAILSNERVKKLR